MDREALEAELRKLPSEAIRAHAARSALRALPFYSAVRRGDAPWWAGREDAPAWLRDLHRAALVASVSASRLLSAFEVNKASLTASRTAFDAARSAGAYSENAASLAAKAVASAAAAAGDIAYTVLRAADAADAAADAVSHDVDFIYAEIFKSKSHVDLFAASLTEAESLLEDPLWHGSAPDRFTDAAAQFRADLLALDQGFDVWVDWYADAIEGRWDWELLKRWTLVPDTVLKGPVDDFNFYLKRLRDEHAGRRDAVVSEPKAPLSRSRRVRAIILGDPEAGKSTLLNALKLSADAPAAPIPDRDPTPGVDRQTLVIEPLGGASPDGAAETRVFREAVEFEATDFVVQFWDFGGQAIIYSTHKVFLRAGCVYVIVVSGRENRDADKQARDWLQIVHAVAPEAPKLVVGNKADAPGAMAQLVFDERSHKETYKHVRCHRIAAKFAAFHDQKHAFATFRDSLIGALSDLAGDGRPYKQAEARVLEEIEARAAKRGDGDGDFVSREEFAEICARHGVEDVGLLARAFDADGVMIDLGGRTRHDEYLIDPRWLTFGVFALMNDPRALASNGTLSYAQIEEILTHPAASAQLDISYPPRRVGFLVDALSAFNLAYQAPGSELRYTFPALLGRVAPDGLMNMRQGIALRLRFTRDVPLEPLHALIVARNADIASDGALVWRHGVQFEPATFPELRAVVIADPDGERAISVHVVHKDSNSAASPLGIRYAEMLLADLRARLGPGDADTAVVEIRLLPDMRRRKPEERIAPAGGESIWCPREIIDDAQSDRESSFRYIGGTYFTHMVLGENAIHADDRQCDIFISYAREQEGTVSQLADLLESAGLSTFWDKDLAGRRNFPDRIVNRINASKVVLVLWTADARDSDWVRREVELAGLKRMHLRVDDFPFSEIPNASGKLDDVRSVTEGAITSEQFDPIFRAIQDRLAD